MQSSERHGHEQQQHLQQQQQHQQQQQQVQQQQRSPYARPSPQYRSPVPGPSSLQGVSRQAFYTGGGQSGPSTASAQMNGYGSPSLPSLYGNGGPQPLRMNDRRPEEQGGSSYAYRQQQQQNGGYFPSNAADGSRSRTQSFPASSPTFTSEQSPTLNSPLTPSSNKAGPSPVVPPSQVAPQRRTRETSSQESAAAALTKTIADGGVDLALAQRLLKEEQMAQSQAGPDRKVSCLECRASKVKCSGQGEGPCARCKRIGRECVFEKHKRGRKPDSLKFQRLEKSFDVIAKALDDFRRLQGKSEGENGMDVEPSGSSTGANGGTSSSPHEHRKRDPSSDRSMERHRHTSPGFASTRLPALHRSESNATYAKASMSPPGGHPDEPSNLGLPVLSNPLKLLAHASDSARDRIEMGGDTGVDPFAHQAGDVQMGDAEDDSQSRGTSTEPDPSRTHLSVGPSRRGYFELGIYSPKLDTESRFDPIARGLLSVTEAAKLFDLFMRRINGPITLLDPVLHTFIFVRSHSAFLLTAMCALAARFSPGSESTATRLDSHIKDTLLPAVLLEGYRSAEISQAFIILGTYHCPTKTVAEDRSWSLLGYAIRIAAELDMNRRILSNEVDENDEPTQRRLRNRERLWMNLWLYEQSMSTHMGRRSTLGIDPVIMSCGQWHRQKWAILEDEAIVAVIQLRRLMAKNIDHFEHSMSLATGQYTTYQLDFFRRSCAADLDSWKATWCRTSSGSSGRAYRLESGGRLYYYYARLLLNSYPLKSSSLDNEILAPIYAESYSSAIAYLHLFLDTLVPEKLIYAHNSTVVTASYCAIFAMRLTSLDKERFPYIDDELTFDLFRRLAEALRDAGAVTPHRCGTAGSYSPYLFAVLAQVQKSRSRRGVNLNGTLAHAAPLTPEVLQFQAGPSGVQASGLANPPGTNGVTFETGYNSYGEGDALDRLLGESLFCDMSFLSNDQLFSMPTV